MRDQNENQDFMFIYLLPEQRGQKNHLFCTIKAFTGDVLRVELDV